MSRLSRLKNISPSSANPSRALRSIKIDNVDALKERSDERIRFSFKLLDTSNGYFNLGDTEKSWFLTLFGVFREVSTYKWKDFLNVRTYDPHPVCWDSKNLNDKPSLDEQFLNQHDAFQFRLNKTKGRVLGFLLGNIFYVHWLDSEHHLTDSPGYGKARKMAQPKTCYDILLEQNEILKKKILELESDVNSLLSK